MALALSNSSPLALFVLGLLLALAGAWIVRHVVAVAHLSRGGSPTGLALDDSQEAFGENGWQRSLLRAVGGPRSPGDLSGSGIGSCTGPLLEIGSCEHAAASSAERAWR